MLRRTASGMGSERFQACGTTNPLGLGGASTWFRSAAASTTPRRTAELGSRPAVLMAHFADPLASRPHLPDTTAEGSITGTWACVATRDICAAADLH
jgi:hypothetical protein